MLDFGKADKHVQVPQQSSEQCSHRPCNNNNHCHSQFHQSCCVSPPSCCRTNSESRCCQSRHSSHSNSSCYASCSSCRPSTCPCHSSTRSPTPQGYYWRDYIPGEIPHDVVEGIDGKYVGQASYKSIVLPVTIYINSNTAVGERSGKQIFTEDIKILCTDDPSNLYWEHVNFRTDAPGQMKHAIRGGHQDGYNLYIGVAYYGGEWMIGKVIPKENGLFKGLQIGSTFGNIILCEFHILKYKAPTRRRNGVRQDFYWRDFIPGELPNDAVRGANDLYIGQVSYDWCNLPATIYPARSVAIVERRGKQIVKQNFKILCSPDATRFYWEKCSSAYGRSGNFGYTPQGFVFGAKTFGSPFNHVSSIGGMPQNMSTCFGTTTGGMSQSQTGLFGAQSNQAADGAGQPTNQSGILFGSQPNQIAPSCGSSSNHQIGISFGSPQGQPTSFGPPSSNRSGTLSDLEQNRVKSGFGLSPSQSGTVFGAEQNQKTKSGEPPSNQSANKAANVPNAQQSFTFGISQALEDSGLEKSFEEMRFHDQRESENSKTSDVTTSKSGQDDEVTPSGSSENVATTNSLPQGGPFALTNFAISTQTPDVKISPQGSPLFGGSQNPEVQSITNEDDKTKDQGEIGSIQGETFSKNSTASSENFQIQEGGLTFGCGPSKIQGASSPFHHAPVQGGSALFGSSQSQASTFGQPRTLGTSATFGQSPAQGGQTFGFGQTQSQGTPVFGQPQTQGTSALFGQSQTQGFGGPGGFMNSRTNNSIFNSGTREQTLKENVKGGYQDGSDLYIGRAVHEGEWKIGKVVLSNDFIKSLYVWGRFNETVILSDFEILKYRSN